MKEKNILDMLRESGKYEVKETVCTMNGRPLIWGTMFIPKGFLKERTTFKPCCYGWIKNRNKS